MEHLPNLFSKLRAEHTRGQSFQSVLEQQYSKANIDEKVVNIDDSNKNVCCSNIIPCHINGEWDVTKCADEGGCDEWHAEDMDPLIADLMGIYTVS